MVIVFVMMTIMFLNVDLMVETVVDQWFKLHFVQFVHVMKLKSCTLEKMSSTFSLTVVLICLVTSLNKKCSEAGLHTIVWKCVLKGHSWHI